MDNIQTGLMVSVVGITITFLALFLFIGVIVGLQKLFPPKPEQAVAEEKSSTAPLLAVADSEDQTEEAEVAAIAAAIYLRSKRSSLLGAALLTGPGPYKTSRQLPKL